MSPLPLWRRLKHGKPVIVVSGLPRSGTSMLMKMLEACGMEIASDGERQADVDNPKGYYELEKVKELDKGRDKSWVRDLRGRVVKMISYFLKELPDTNNYRVVFMIRDLREVMASQDKMLSRRGEPVDPEKDDRMVANFEKHLASTKRMLARDSKFEVLYVDHRDVVQNPREQAEEICRFLGVPLRVDDMAAIVDPSLYRNRSNGNG